MPPLEIELASLERQMVVLCNRRAGRLETAARIMRQANADYDEAALPIGRRIQVLRATLEAQKPAPKDPTRQPSEKHDPDWCQQDIDHFYELKRRGNKTANQR